MMHACLASVVLVAVGLLEDGASDGERRLLVDRLDAAEDAGDVRELERAVVVGVEHLEELDALRRLEPHLREGRIPADALGPLVREHRVALVPHGQEREGEDVHDRRGQAQQHERGGDEQEEVHRVEPVRRCEKV